MVITITCGQITFSGLDGRQKKERSGRGKRRTEREFGKEEHQERGGKRKTTRKERPLEKTKESLRMKRGEE
jgi:hypothetical protein